jgi:hypothetical protein
MLYNGLRDYSSILQAKFARGALEGRTKTELAQAIAKPLEHAAKLPRGSFSGTWFRRYRRTEMELGRRVSFPRGF